MIITIFNIHNNVLSLGMANVVNLYIKSTSVFGNFKCYVFFFLCHKCADKHLPSFANNSLRIAVFEQVEVWC